MGTERARRGERVRGGEKREMQVDSKEDGDGRELQKEREREG